MTISTIDESQRKAAKVAGFTCLFTMAIVVFSNFRFCKFVDETDESHCLSQLWIARCSQV